MKVISPLSGGGHAHLYFFANYLQPLFRMKIVS